MVVLLRNIVGLFPHWGQNKAQAKADDVLAIVRLAPEAVVVKTGKLGAIQPGAAARLAILTAGSGGVGQPLPNVAGHIGHAVRAVGRRRIPGDRGRASLPGFAGVAAAGGELIAPRIAPAGAPSRSAPPFPGSRQAFTCP